MHKNLHAPSNSPIVHEAQLDLLQVSASQTYSEIVQHDIVPFHPKRPHDHQP